MFDLRYHVASLAAVFVALIIGILVGVGLAGSGVNQADLQLARAQNDDLQKSLASAQAQIKQLKQTQEAFQQGYPALMEGRLADKQIAVLFVGPVDAGIESNVEQTLQDAGAPPPLRLRAVDVPIDPVSLDSLLSARPTLTKYVGDDKLTALGRELGAEFANGEATPLWNLAEITPPSVPAARSSVTALIRSAPLTRSGSPGSIPAW